MVEMSRMFPRKETRNNRNRNRAAITLNWNNLCFFFRNMPMRGNCKTGSIKIRNNRIKFQQFEVLFRNTPIRGHCKTNGIDKEKQNRNRAVNEENRNSNRAAITLIWNNI